MNSRALALVSALAAATACSGSSAPPPAYPTVAVAGLHDGGGAGARVAGGRFSRAEVEHAIAAEQDHLLELDRRIQETEANADPSSAAGAAVAASVLRGDRVAAASFVAQLMACLDDAEVCPPSLAEPLIPRDFDPSTGEMTSEVTVDPAAWPRTAAQLEQNACGCRTSACVAWVLADLARWEAAVPQDVQADETAAAHVTGARACLWARLGRRVSGSLPTGAS